MFRRSAGDGRFGTRPRRDLCGIRGTRFVTVPALKVYGRATSSNVQALLWGMHELGLAYDRVDCGEVFGGLDSDSFRRMNPHGRIPVLELEDGRALFETGAILRYLAGIAGQGAFWPEDPVARAQVDMWAEWAKYQVAGAFTGPVFWRTVRTHAQARDPVAIARATETFEAALETGLAQVHEGGFLCGAELSLADIQFGHVLYRYQDAGLARRALPGLADYYERLTKRPAYQTAVMVSYDTLRDTFGVKGGE